MLELELPSLIVRILETFASNLVFFGVGNCRFSLSQSLMMSDDDLEASLVAKLPFSASKLVLSNSARVTYCSSCCNVAIS